MASRRNPPRRPGSRGQGTKATIDLKAKEVRNEPKGEEKSDGKSEGAAPASRSSSSPSSSSSSSSVASGGDKKSTGSAPLKEATSKSIPKPPARGADDKPGAKSTGFAGRTAETKSKGTPGGSASPKAEENKSDKKTAASPSEPRKPASATSGMLSHLAAGVVGALAVLFGAPYVTGQTGGSSQSAQVDAAALKALQRQVATLDKRVADAATAASKTAELAPLDERLSAVEGVAGTVKSLVTVQTGLAEQAKALDAQLKELAEAPAKPAALSPEMTQRLGRLEETLRTLAAAAEEKSDGALPQLAALSGRINDFSDELGTKLQAMREEVGTEIAAAEARVTNRTEALGTTDARALEAVETLRAGSKRLGLEIETLKSGATSITGELERTASAVSDNASAIAKANSGIERVEKAVASLSGSMDQTLQTLASDADVAAAVGPISAKMEDLSSALSGVVSREQTRRQSSRRIVLALELAELKRALDRGEPIKGLLDKVKTLAPEGIDLEPLDKYAGATVPTASQLQQKFASVARSAIAADTASQGDGGVLDQLFSGARSMVQVRRKGDIPGDTTEAIVARTEMRLADGKLDAALKEAKSLKGDAAAAVDEWLGLLEARVVVDGAMASIERELKSSLAGPATN